MSDEVTLEGARILIVEDEADVVETLKEMLDMCAVDTASDFESGKALLDKNGYDIAIFDIMGVRGYDLLAIAREKNLPAMMLTAHALTAEDFSRSITGGAVAYIPKEKMSEIGVYLTDLLKAKAGMEKPHKWFSRLASFFDSIYGLNETYLELKRKFEKEHGPLYYD